MGPSDESMVVLVKIVTGARATYWILVSVDMLAVVGCSGSLLKMSVYMSRSRESSTMRTKSQS